MPMQMPNSLMPPSGEPQDMQPAAQTAGGVHPMVQHFGQAHDQAKAQVDKLKEGEQRLSAIRSELDKLTKLGDMISQEDVIKSAGKIVAAGLSPNAVAGLLADMPADGEALQSWVEQQDVKIKTIETNSQAQLDMARHNLGIKAMSLLAGHAITSQPQGDEEAGPKGTGEPAPQSLGRTIAPGQSDEATGGYMNALMGGASNV